MDATDEIIERDRHLEAIGAWIAAHGLANLTEDTAAAAARVSADELREFFDSKEEVVAALLARSRARHREMFTRVLADLSLDNTQRRRNMWQYYMRGENDLRLFFEAYGMALHDERYRDFIAGIEDWMALLSDALIAQGIAPGMADTYSTLVIAVYRGAMLDYCITGNRARVNAAMELWFHAADLLEKAGVS